MDDYYAKKSTIDEIRARFDADVERFSNLATGQISTVDAPLAMELISCAVLHHLRDDEDWEFAFKKIFSILKKGGSLWITDLVGHSIPSVQNMMRGRYGEYLSKIGGDDYRDKVFKYIDHEDTPRSLYYQIELMKK